MFSQSCSTFFFEKQDSVATNCCRIKDIIVLVTYYLSQTPLWRSPRTTSAAQKTAFITTTAHYYELRCRQSILEPFQLFVVSWRYQLSWPLDLSHSFRSDIRTVAYWNILLYIRLYSLRSRKHVFNTVHYFSVITLSREHSQGTVQEVFSEMKLPDGSCNTFWLVIQREISCELDKTLWYRWASRAVTK